MSNWDYANVVPATSWRSASTIPRELILVFDKGHYYLTSLPVSELGGLRIKSDTASVRLQSFDGEKEIPTRKISLMQSEMLFGFDLTSTHADTVGIILENNLKEKLIIGYSKSQKQFFIDRREAGKSDFSTKFGGISTAEYDARPILKLHLFIDVSSVEMFVDDGRVVMTNLVFPSEKYTHLKVFSKGGSVLLNKAVIYGLSDIWPASE
jgi:sucrose-6-phosphate hydrolase SacC (GH32 family)